MNLVIRPPTKAEVPAFRAALARGFARHVRPEPEELDLFTRRFERDRALAVFDSKEIVGTTDIFSFDLTVPGGASVPAAGVTMVTVSATHRRQGILRKIMADQLVDVHERAEPLAFLWAQESGIYGRFGYGMSIQHERWTIERRHAALAHLPNIPGTVRWIEEKEARTKFPPVWARACATRPGMPKREQVSWDFMFYDAEHRRFGASQYFFVAYEEKGRTDGYAVYRLKYSWTDGHDNHVVMVSEVVTATDAAYAAIWRFLLNIDLSGSLETYGRPLDDPLMWMLEDPRRLHRSPHDAIWVRLIDVAGALSKRTYAIEGKLIIEVRDDFCPWVAGRYELDGGPDGATCTATRKSADLTLGAEELGAIYMGGTKLSPFARAGRVEEKTDGALAKADLMFSASPAPWCPQGF